MGRHCDAQRGSISVFRLQLQGSHKVTHAHTKTDMVHIYIKERKQTHNLRYSEVSELQDKIVRVILTQAYA